MAMVLSVEDDPEITQSLNRSLGQLGYTVTACPTGSEALNAVLVSPPDVVLLDLGLPDMDGATFLLMLRSVSRVPVVVVTARVERAEVIRLLDLGADDYVTKPFAAAELDARIRAVLRRIDPPSTASPQISIGGMLIDAQRHEVLLDGARLQLRKLEYDILLLLALNRGQVLSVAAITQNLWGQASADATARLDVHLFGLRAHLGESAREPRYIHRVRGVGLILDEPRE